MIVPNKINKPIFFEVSANPLRTSSMILKNDIFKQNPKKIDPIKRTTTGFNLSIEVPIIIHKTVIVINKISKYIIGS